ncbi:MAG: MerR family transcriptional regulator [Caulobacterales bacterium]
MIGAAQSALHADKAAAELSGVTDGAAAPDEGSSKLADGFLSIGEAAAELDLPAYVLRYWETQFEGLQPLKRSGGRRYYRPEDIAFLKRLRSLLHEQAYTIRGAQRLLASELSAPGTFQYSNFESNAQLTTHGLQAALERAVEAGSFDGVFSGQAGQDPNTLAQGVVTRLTDALDLLVEAKTRLDAVRRSA